VVVWDANPASMRELENPGLRIGRAVVDALADLHQVDYDACGPSREQLYPEGRQLLAHVLSGSRPPKSEDLARP
jgi:hypothetical protein